MYLFEFVEKLKNIQMRHQTKLVSYDATALFPSVKIKDALKHIQNLLETDTTIPESTKMTLKDIIGLIDTCFSSSNFTYDEHHHTTNDSGPIGLLLMVTVSQILMIYTMEEAIKVAKSRGCIIPRNIFIYMDDCFCTVADPPLRPGGV